MSGDRLARRYRRLLVAYPRTYRRERGDEMLGDLLDAALPERTRPTLREAVDLLRNGLRARLGRPASRTVVTWALLVTVISGAFSAAFATRAAWETAPSLPGGPEARSMLAQIVPGQEFTGFESPSALFTVFGQPLDWSMAHDMLLGDGGEYALAGIGARVVGAPVLPAEDMVAVVLRNLRAHGWTVYPTLSRDMYGCVGPPCDPTTIPQYTTIAARRGETTFMMEVYPTGSGVSPEIWASFQQATPLAVYPFGIAAGVLGAVVAFLAFGWASRRTQRRPLAGATAKAMLGFTVFLWWAPTAFALPLMVRHHVVEPHPAWHPMWEWFGQPTYSLPFVLGCGFALAGLAVAALARSDRTPLNAVAAAG